MNIAQRDINRGAFREQGTQKDKHKNKAHLNVRRQTISGMNRFLLDFRACLWWMDTFSEVKYRPEAPVRFSQFMPVHIGQWFFFLSELHPSLIEIIISSFFFSRKWKPSFVMILRKLRVGPCTVRQPSDKSSLGILSCWGKLKVY